MPQKRASGQVPVEDTKHGGNKRKNIPTAELESFAGDDERDPGILRYPRDPSLDPQLVWKGKDEQDGRDLEVPVVPIYIQETIEPRALIEDLRTSSKGLQEDQVSFFDSFHELEFNERVEFYEHEGKWTNRMILGDSLLVMASLAEKEGLKAQIQMIYMDPPYGIKFGSNWQVSTRNRDVQDGRVENSTRQPEQIRAFRDTWRLGIHSYLGYLRDRAVLARDLLSQSGSVFVQIGDENVHLVRAVLDEVFGSGNFVSLITFAKTTGATSEFLPGTADYLLWYAKSRADCKYRPLHSLKVAGGAGAGKYDQVEIAGGLRRAMTVKEKSQPQALPEGSKIFRLGDLTSQRPPGDFPVEIDGRVYRPRRGYWKTSRDGMARLVAARRVEPTGNTLSYVRFIDDFPAYPITNVWGDIGGIQSRADPKVFVVQTATTVVERCLLMTTDPGDLVLDPTCGSGTTPVVAEQWGRRWIAIDTSRVALAVARSRLMTSKYPFFTLADSPEGVVLEANRSGQSPPSPMPPTAGDLRRGFVYERVPHITLKSIAQNPDIEDGMSRAEVAEAIHRYADTEILFDRPNEDKHVVRVSGPFTVESLSPPRVLDSRDMHGKALDSSESSSFVDGILESLLSAGVQNTVKAERLSFERLEPWAGEYIQASGAYMESGKSRSVAICVGPEHGTVGTELVREAAKEASKFFDLLVICGFAFEAHVGEETSQIGRLTVLKAKMNPDLLMPDLLKKTGAANLFMVFGEPDIEIRREGGSVVVEIRGLDVYDPTTGEVRNHSADDIAAWFIDTNYNGESFFVRHAYFVGADDPYQNLKRALKADVDENIWEALNSTTSRPFPKPTTSKIAVKVINHYGDEVLRVYES